MAKIKNENYDESSIQVLQGLEPVRKKYGLYIGNNDANGLWQILKEVISNSIDEALAKFNNHITIVIDTKNNKFLVADGGRGIPVGVHKVSKISTLTTILTMLHAGGKIDDKSGGYKQGSHGCLAGETEVKLLNGASVSMETLYNRWVKNPKPFWVYSYDTKGDTAFTPKKCVNVLLSKYVDEVAVVTLDTGVQLRVTPDHPFLLFNDKYKEAAKLKAGERLRALYTTTDKDGYELHSGRSGKGRGASMRTNRTVAKVMGWDIVGKHVHHITANKKDNRPNKLRVLNQEAHYWADRQEHNKHALWNKTRTYESMANSTKKINSNPENGKNAQIGKIVRCAARAINTYGILTPETFDKSRGWCYPSSKTVEFYFSWKKLATLANNYIRINKNSLGKLKRELGYKLQSDYSNSPADNYANHFVKSVKIVKLKKAIPVYDLSIEGVHNYLLTSGVFVHNTFGVGVSVTNALSKSLIAYTCREGKWYTQQFKRGKPITDVKTIKKDKLPKFAGFAGKGTIIEFESDEEIFGKTKFHEKEPIKWIKTISYFFPEVKWSLTVDGKTEEFQHKEGIAGLVNHWLTQSEAEAIGKTFYFQSANVTCALQWAASDDEQLSFYVNGLEVKQGTHANALSKVIMDAFNKLKTAKQEFKIDDLKVGLFGILNISLPSPAFGGQTKEKLISPEATALVRDALTSEFTVWLAKNKATAKTLIQRAVDLSKAESTFKVNKKFAAKMQSTKKGRTLLPSNLSTSITNDPKLRELFLIEGKSAEGAAKDARDPQFQEILPLRGKILNVIKASDERIAANKEFEQILQSAGYNPSLKNPFEKLRVNRIMLLADADADGKHINLLFSGAIYKALRPLIEQGRVFAVHLPLYTAPLKNKRVYGYTLAELQKKLPASYNANFITRMKGLGESLHPSTAIGGISIKNLKHYVPTVLGNNDRFELIEKEKTEIGTVVTKGGFLMPHPNHPILICRDLEMQWVASSEIVEGDYLLNKPGDNPFEFVVTGNMPITYLTVAQCIKSIADNKKSLSHIDPEVCLPGTTHFNLTLVDEKPFLKASEVIDNYFTNLTKNSTHFIDNFHADAHDLLDKVLTLLAVEARLGLRWTPFIRSTFYKEVQSHVQYDVSLLTNAPSEFPLITNNSFMANNFVVHNCNPDVLTEIAFNPATRNLIQLMPVKGKHAKRFLSTLAKEGDFRKEILGLSNEKSQIKNTKK